MAGLKSTAQVGVREDLSDLITLADMRQTSFVSMCPKGTEPTNMKMDWQFDDYLNPSTRGHLSDVDRKTFENFTGRVRMDSYCQIFERAPMVGRIAEKINDVAGVGRKKEMAKSVAKALVVAKRDIEVTCLSAVECAPEAGETPYSMRGLFTWAQASLATEATAPIPTKAQAVTDAIYTGAYASLTESVFRDTMLGGVWEVTGSMSDFQFFCGRHLKSLITSWSVYTPNVASTTPVRVFQVETGADEDMRILRAAVDVIEGDFGRIELNATPWLRWDLDLSVAANLALSRCSGIGFDPEKLELRFNQMPSFRPFEDKGGGPRGLVEAIGGLLCYNPKMLLCVNPSSPT